MSGSACGRNCRPACYCRVHDELIVEAPENEVEQVSRIEEEEMEQIYSIPLTAEVGTIEPGWKRINR